VDDKGVVLDPAKLKTELDDLLAWVDCKSPTTQQIAD